MAFISICLFSLYTIFGKLLLEQVSPFTILLATEILAATIMILIVDAIRQFKNLKLKSKADLKTLTLIALFSSVIGPLLFLIGLTVTSATNSILIAKSEAVMTAFLAILILREKITRNQIIGSVIMFFGITIIATNNFATGLTWNIGDVLVLLSTVSYAIGTIIFKKSHHHIDPEAAVTFRNLFGALILFIIALFYLDFSTIPKAFSFSILPTLLGLVILPTIGGQYFWYKALEVASATKVSIAGLTSPLITMIYAVIILKETIITSQIIGGLLIIIGLIIIEFHFKSNWSELKRKRYLKFKKHLHI